MPQASVLKRGQVQNLSCEMIFYYHANKTHFHKKGFALGLVLTRKWPIETREIVNGFFFVNGFVFYFFCSCCALKKRKLWIKISSSGESFRKLCVGNETFRICHIQLHR